MKYQNNHMDISSIKNRLLGSRLFKDSFWAVFGNGMGNAMMLLAGILIARLLGKDLYGEYGVVKSTMFYVASFATFGLGFTSTKFIAQYVTDQKQYVKAIMRDSITITLAFSGTIAVLLIVFAQQLADYVEAPSLKLAFQALAGVIVFKAMTTTQIGLLSGHKEFKKTARNSVASGVFLLIICVPFTYFGGLKGSLLALMSSQAFNAFINYCTIRKITKKLPDQENKSFKKELISFSFPVALQESSYTISHWGAIMFLTKLSSMGEVGLYTASSQWLVIITMIPALLSNVVLSYLYSSVSNKASHSRTIRLMLAVNLVCTLIPFVIVFIFSNFISSFYGETFSDMGNLLRLITLSTIFESCSTVFKSEFMAQGKTWLLFTLRTIRDFSALLATYVVLMVTNGNNGAFSFGLVNVTMSILFFVSCILSYIITSKNSK